MYKATQLCQQYAQMDIESVPGFGPGGHWYETVSAWPGLYPDDLVDGAGTIKGTFEAATPSGEVTYGSYSCEVTNFDQVKYSGFDNNRE